MLLTHSPPGQVMLLQTQPPLDEELDDDVVVPGSQTLFTHCPIGQVVLLQTQPGGSQTTLTQTNGGMHCVPQVPPVVPLLELVVVVLVVPPVPDVVSPDWQTYPVRGTGPLGRQELSSQPTQVLATTNAISAPTRAAMALRTRYSKALAFLRRSSSTAYRYLWHESSSVPFHLCADLPSALFFDALLLESSARRRLGCCGSACSRGRDYVAGRSATA